MYRGELSRYQIGFCDDKGFTLALLTLHEEDLIAALDAECGDRR